MRTMNITEKGQVVIPKDLREKYGIELNGAVIVTEISGHIAVLPIDSDPVRTGRGMFRFAKPVSEMIRESRSEERVREVRLSKRRKGPRD